jgi:hypothetical protein
MKKANSSTLSGAPSIKKGFKGFYLVLSSLFITLVHLPFAFAKNMAMQRTASKSMVIAEAPLPMPSPMPIPPGDSTSMFSYRSVYDSLHLNLSGLSRQAFDYARKGWEKLVQEGRLIKTSVIAIVDFSQPSSNKRLYVLDMNNYKMLFNTLVAHGRNSGKEWASSFSNRSASYKSSPGFYITGETYNGGNGYSLKLSGVEKGINDNALRRAIVMHGAEYVSESFIDRQGYIGRSQGCPAVPAEQADEIINTLKEGACLFVYTPDYVKRSAILKS